MYICMQLLLCRAELIMLADADAEKLTEKNGNILNVTSLRDFCVIVTGCMRGNVPGIKLIRIQPYWLHSICTASLIYNHTSPVGFCKPDVLATSLKLVPPFVRS